MKKIIDIEQKICSNTDLLEVVKDYCECNYEKTPVAVNLLPLIKIIISNNKKLLLDIDKLA